MVWPFTVHSRPEATVEVTLGEGLETKVRVFLGLLVQGGLLHGLLVVDVLAHLAPATLYSLTSTQWIVMNEMMSTGKTKVSTYPVCIIN